MVHLELPGPTTVSASDVVPRPYLGAALNCRLVRKPVVGLVQTLKPLNLVSRYITSFSLSRSELKVPVSFPATLGYSMKQSSKSASSVWPWARAGYAAKKRSVAKTVLKRLSIFIIQIANQISVGFWGFGVLGFWRLTHL